jgi:hypothetical protein
MKCGYCRFKVPKGALVCGHCGVDFTYKFDWGTFIERVMAYGVVAALVFGGLAFVLPITENWFWIFVLIFLGISVISWAGRASIVGLAVKDGNVVVCK